jgi:hypothetical protein
MELYITEEGYRSMLTKGLSSAITQFSMTDQYEIYGLDSLPTLPNLTGTKFSLGGANPACNLAGYQGIPQNPLPPEVNNALNRRVGVNIFSSDCDGGFDLNGVTIKFHVNRYFNFLQTFLTQSYNFSFEGLTQQFYDYTYGTLEQEDVINGGFNILDNVQELDVRINFNSETDKNNYTSFSNRYIEVIGSGAQIFRNGRTGVYNSPFQLDFVSFNAGSSFVPGSGLKLSMMPDEFGYTIDGDYYTLTNANNLFTQNGMNNYEKIIPTAKIGATSYFLDTFTNYNTIDPLLGQFTYGFKTSDGTRTLLEDLIERGILYMKTKGELVGGVYKLPIGYKIDLYGNEEFNLAYNNNNYGGGVQLEFVYDSTDASTTDIMEIN